MNSESLDRILEEALSAVTDRLPQLVENASNNGLGTILSNHVSTINDFGLYDVSGSISTFQRSPDISNSDATAQSTPIEAVNENRDSGRDSGIDFQTYYESIDDFSVRWFRYLREYNENIRLYNQNITNANRVSQLFLRHLMTLQPTPRERPQTETQNLFMPRHVRNFLENNGFGLEVQGFSIPIRSAIETETQTHPTITQIMNATEIFTFNENNMTRVPEPRCPISLEDFVLGEELCQIKHCSHIFKWNTLQTWFSRNSHCPVCRYDIRDYAA